MGVVMKTRQIDNIMKTVLGSSGMCKTDDEVKDVMNNLRDTNSIAKTIMGLELDPPMLGMFRDNISGDLAKDAVVTNDHVIQLVTKQAVKERAKVPAAQVAAGGSKKRKNERDGDDDGVSLKKAATSKSSDDDKADKGDKAGKADKAAGKLQNAVGGIKDAAKGH